MRLIAERYRKLRPVMECLADEVVIAQAWKKTHAYMRRHNWYADTLALDVSAIALETIAKRWAADVASGNVKTYNLELVPAPKSEAWAVRDKTGWGPQADRNGRVPVRPLAHLRVRDQTWATAVMMCLADYVESAQGDPSVGVAKAAAQGVSSYGNRLLCDWRDDDAWFRWGNGETYRKFFTDYQTFLKRPVEIGRLVGQGTSSMDQVHVVSLDIAQFYDRIDRPQLLARLRKLAERQADYEESPDFWDTASRILDWTWDASDRRRANRLGLDLGNGLPQGLVSAGFFANAYLLEFDNRLSRAVGKTLPGTKAVLLHDYVRYVDDIRLVVSGGELDDAQEVRRVVSDWVSGELQRYGGESLSVNPSKTKVVSLEDLDNTASLSGRITQVQSQLSGPTDRDSLDSISALLEGLLTVPSDGLPREIEGDPDAALIKVARFDGDIRADTLKRFAATRLEAVMRKKRKVDFSRSEGPLGRRGAVDNESELLAKKMIWAWMQDPSLALVLRKALEIYPSPELAEPAVEAIFRRCSFRMRRDRVTGAMFDYLLADIFRFGVELDSRLATADYPAGTDAVGMLGLFVRFAHRALNAEAVPDFVARQALMLLAVRRAPMSGERHNGLEIQYDLLDILAGRDIEWKHQRIALYEVASQITGEPDTIAALFLQNALSQSGDAIDAALEELAKRGGALWNGVWMKLKRSPVHLTLAKKFSWAAPIKAGPPLTRRQTLSKLAASSENPFVQEAALLKLGRALIQLAPGAMDKKLSPRDVIVSWRRSGRRVSWREAWHPEVALTCEATELDTLPDPRFGEPAWLSEQADAPAIYWVGAVLRSAVVGSSDFTSRRWKSSASIGYKGLRTAWYKRRMGMMHSPEVLVGDYATVSTWVSELLMQCLQWPGFESTHLMNSAILAIESLADLDRVLAERLAYVDSMVCAASNLPTVVTPVERHFSRIGSPFRLVTVQQLLPRTKEFSVGDVTLSNPRLRVAGRDHLSRICEVVYSTLVTQTAAEGKEPDSKADLIVFPEVAVHPDDLDLLKTLADKSRSMIFAGLVFTEHEGAYVNTARWIIPSYTESGRQWVVRNQGKGYMTRVEKKLGIKPHRPCQHIIRLSGDAEGPFNLSGTICYDATDLRLAADMADKSDLFVIAAHNKDVTTFDTMASALHYHMYQHVTVVNKGEFGGSTIQAPYKERFHRLISHAHGTEQISVNIADLDLAAFKRKEAAHKEVKDPPAGSLSA